MQQADQLLSLKAGGLTQLLGRQAINHKDAKNRLSAVSFFLLLFFEGFFAGWWFCFVFCYWFFVMSRVVRHRVCVVIVPISCPAPPPPPASTPDQLTFPIMEQIHRGEWSSPLTDPASPLL